MSDVKELEDKVLDVLKSAEAKVEAAPQIVAEFIDKMEIDAFAALQREAQYVATLLELAQHKAEVARLKICMKYKLGDNDQITGEGQIIRK